MVTGVKRGKEGRMPWRWFKIFGRDWITEVGIVGAFWESRSV